MIGIDTNVLARYYVADEADTEADKQHIAAKRLMESGEPLMVCKTVVLELEWVLRGYYGFSQAEVASVLRHLLALPQITLEDRLSIEQALTSGDAGIAFADALHHASYRECDSMASFDDKKFARRAKRAGLIPVVLIPT